MVGLQWGDEGKGKVVDYLAGKYDAVVRFNGGSNAGHTVVVGERRRTFHLVPSGALKGKNLLIGAGVALDPVVLREELGLLPPSVRQRLLVDGRCTLISPLEKEFDRVLEEMRGASAVGTTLRGIGPSYAMRALRLSPRISDILLGFDFGPLESFYGKFGIGTAGVISWAEETKGLLEGITGDVAANITSLCDRGGSVLYESSQGALLDLTHGSYPYVTSTHTLATYVPAALGIASDYAGEPLGVLKCYATRVGGGPFPTEQTGQLADSIRSLGNEYGATTGRPRRVGWLDLVALKFAVKVNGVKDVVVSKLDVLSEVGEFKVCVAYELLGSETTDFQRCLPHLSEVRPVYESPFSLHGATFGTTLPAEGREFVDYLEKQLGVRVAIVSHGEERASTIEL